MHKTAYQKCSSRHLTVTLCKNLLPVCEKPNLDQHIKPIGLPTFQNKNKNRNLYLPKVEYHRNKAIDTVQRRLNTIVISVT